MPTALLKSRFKIASPYIAAMMATIQTDGRTALPPISVDATGQRPALLDGNHRLAAHLLHGEKMIRAMVRRRRSAPSSHATPAGRAIALWYGEGTLEARIADAYASLAGTDGVVRISALRTALPDVPRETLDAAIDRLAFYQHARIMPDPKLRGAHPTREDGGCYAIGGWHHLVTRMLGHVPKAAP